MANQDFLDDWAIDRVMREENGGGVSTGTAKGLQTHFFCCFVFCLLIQPIIVLLPLSNCSVYNKCAIHIKW